MNSKQKARLALLKVQIRAVELGVMTSIPSSDDCRYDLIVDDGSVLRRAQVKWAGLEPSHAANAVQIDLRKDSQEGPKKRVYTASEIDLLLAYVPQIDRVVALGPEHFNGKSSLVVRLDAPKNGQLKGLRMAKDFYW